jgi:hypothetical protein
MNLAKISLVLACLTALTACAGKLGPASVRAEPTETLNASEPRAPLALPLVSPRIVVKKAARKLLLYSAGKLIRT